VSRMKTLSLVGKGGKSGTNAQHWS
jgi:hypothetical protein